MIRLTLTALALLPAVAFAQSGPLPLPGTLAQDQPGRPTQARFYILNKDPRTEAVPVTIAPGTEAMRVTVAGTPAVSIAGTVAADTRVVRQLWEYQQIVVREGDDAVSVLNAAGTQGWELTGTWPRATAVTLLLKRPK